jgi:hypothetical protein
MSESEVNSPGLAVSVDKITQKLKREAPTLSMKEYHEQGWVNSFKLDDKNVLLTGNPRSYICRSGETECTVLMSEIDEKRPKWSFKSFLSHCSDILAHFF